MLDSSSCSVMDSSVMDFTIPVGLQSFVSYLCGIYSWWPVGHQF